MALIKCKECGKEISDQGKSCPNCGTITGKLKNKKKIIIISILSILFALLAISLFVIYYPNTNNFSSEQVIKYLQRRGFEFDSYKIIGKNGTGYYILIEKGNIEMLLMYLENNEPSYHWRNSNINNTWADFSENGNNNIDEEKEQYTEFVEWLEEINLTKKQLRKAIEYYYENETYFRIKKQ